jgi:hypothetical protein
MRVRNPSLRACALALALALTSAAWAGTPSVSVPSTPDAAGKVVVRGSDFTPNTSITVRFSRDGMTPIDMVAQVSPEGRFVLSFAPPLTGAYTVQVFAGGREVGHGNFGRVQ